jgi:hypothetical protein
MRLPWPTLLLYTLLGLIVLLVACQSTTPASISLAVTPPALPTLAAIVAVDVTAPEATNPGSGLPPTWTPPAGGADGHSLVGSNAVTPQPSRTPTAVATLPTRTPTAVGATLTPSPTPTATPYIVTILPPTDQLGPSKLGIHIIQNNDPRIMDFVRRAQPAVIKAVGDLGFLQQVKTASPRTVTIGRVNDLYAQNYIGQPEEAARDYVNKNLPTYQLNPGVDYWEGWNEPDPNMDNMEWYARFEAERLRQMQMHNLSGAIGGFATGVPELDEFYLFLPAIDAALEYGGILTLHEYGAPELTYLYGSPLPGQPAYADRGALKFRYRWFYEDVLIPMNKVVPLAITEAGVDGIIGNRHGPPGGGWHDFGSYWVQQGWGPTPEQAFINQLAWYDVGTRQDGYVMGFTVFTAGGIAQWGSYDINSLLPQLADYVVGQQRRPTPEP